MLIMAYKHPLLYVGLWGISAAFICFHAYTSGPIKREKSRRTILIVIVAFLSLNLIKHHKPLLETYTAESFRLPDSRDYSWLSPDLRGGPSMEPILVYHDRFLVIKSKKYMPNRGDVVVFKPPKEGKIPYIKPGDEVFYNLKIPYIMRVAATAGETIEIKGNSLYIDGHKIQWSLIVTPDYYPENFGVEEPYKVPENCFYVLGDNTGNSYDSRFLGAIPLSDLIGKAYMIYWPPFRIGPIR
jgi:signal peptidase I